ncbi:MAG: biotin/lipoyl-containing protein, partial [Acidimicrobiia bacterium]
MPTVFRLPDIGEGLTEAEVVEWHAAVGDEVRADQPLVTVETDKAQVELPAPVAGVLLHRGAEAGTVLPVGDVLAVIGIRGERWSGGPEPTTDDQVALPLDEPGPERPPLVGTLSEEAESLSALPEPPRRAELSEPRPTPQLEPGIARRPDLPPPGPSASRSPTARPRALPLVRREAARRGIDLSQVEGSGPGGRVLRSDLDAGAERPPSGVVSGEVEEIPPSGGMGPTTEASGRGEPSTPAEPAPPTDERLPLSATRKAIARALTESWQTI